MPSLSRTLINALLPKGSIWSAKVGGFFDALLEGIADAFEMVRLRLAELADVRNAKKTTLLDELERDYGVTFNPALTESERRAALDARINSTDDSGSRGELERALQRAGFPLFVYSNSPAVDPSKFNINYLMVAGGENAYAGVSTAIAGAFAADIVVNGDIVVSRPVYSMVAGGENAYAGVSTAQAGITGLLEQVYEYFLPNNSVDWPFLFFIGGSAEFAQDGSLVSIERVNIDDDRRLELREIVLKYKPTFTWGALLVDYI